MENTTQNGSVNPLEKLIYARYGMEYGAKYKFAKDLGLSRSAISLIGAGKFRRLKPKTREGIIKVLALSGEKELNEILMATKKFIQDSQHKIVSTKDMLETSKIVVHTIVEDTKRFRMSNGEGDMDAMTVPMPGIINADKYTAVGHKVIGGTVYLVFLKQNWANKGDDVLVKYQDGYYGVEICDEAKKQDIVGKLEFEIRKH